MLPFATEFPIKKLPNRAAFLGEVVGWLKGTEYSTVLASGSEVDLNSEYAYILSESGEELRLRELQGADDWTAIGFRHDFPDDAGRLWRTECVVRRAAAECEQDLIRLRTQCLAVTPSARVETPRKPYLIKALLRNGWGGDDAGLVVSDQPVWLREEEDALGVARAIIVGSAPNWLPVVYVSCLSNGGWILDKDTIERLSYTLGGVAHVVVEPSREFSFRLRDGTAGQNVYGGFIGIAIPTQGIIKRFHVGLNFQNAKDLVAAVQSAVIKLRGLMPSRGWDWSELQETALNLQREKHKNSLTTSEADNLFSEFAKQNEELQSEIRQLKERLKDAVVHDIGNTCSENSLEPILGVVGPEIYSGEIRDRIRLSAKIALSNADRIGLDKRSAVVFRRISEHISPSQGLRELTHDLDLATKSADRSAGDLASLLCRYGYRYKSENRHIRMEPIEEFEGIESVTISKTPSEYRGLKNIKSQILRALGLNKL